MSLLGFKVLTFWYSVRNRNGYMFDNRLDGFSIPTPLSGLIQPSYLFGFIPNFEIHTYEPNTHLRNHTITSSPYPLTKPIFMFNCYFLSNFCNFYNIYMMDLLMYSSCTLSWVLTNTNLSLVDLWYRVADIFLAYRTVFGICGLVLHILWDFWFILELPAWERPTHPTKSRFLFRRPSIWWQEHVGACWLVNMGSLASCFSESS